MQAFFSSAAGSLPTAPWRCTGGHRPVPAAETRIQEKAADEMRAWQVPGPWGLGPGRDDAQPAGAGDARGHTVTAGHDGGAIQALTAACRQPWRCSAACASGAPSPHPHDRPSGRYRGLALSGLGVSCTGSGYGQSAGCRCTLSRPWPPCQHSGRLRRRAWRRPRPAAAGPLRSRA